MPEHYSTTEAPAAVDLARSSGTNLPDLTITAPCGARASAGLLAVAAARAPHPLPDSTNLLSITSVVRTCLQCSAGKS